MSDTEPTRARARSYDRENHREERLDMLERRGDMMAGSVDRLHQRLYDRDRERDRDRGYEGGRPHRARRRGKAGRCMILDYSY